jgi:hypothetical protein
VCGWSSAAANPETRGLPGVQEDRPWLARARKKEKKRVSVFLVGFSLLFLFIFFKVLDLGLRV